MKPYLKIQLIDIEWSVFLHRTKDFSLFSPLDSIFPTVILLKVSFSLLKDFDTYKAMWKNPVVFTTSLYLF